MFVRTGVLRQEALGLQIRHTHQASQVGGQRSGWCALLALVVVLVSACAPDPQRAQTVELLGRLVAARGMFMDQPPRAQPACDEVGFVQTRLNYEPGLTNVRPAWAALSSAAEALQAVCGESSLLAQPAIESLAVTQAHQRWQQAVQREIDVACDHLRAAARALDHASPC
jgi:hypothetical protein